MTAAEALAELRRRNIAAAEAMLENDGLSRQFVARLKKEGRTAEKCRDYDCWKNACGFCTSKARCV